MKRRYGWISLMLVAVLMCALCVPARAAGAVSQIKLNQVQQNRETLTMYLSLSDNAGLPMQGSFTADEFTVQMDEVTFPADSLTPFDPSTSGINYCFCIDISKSLSDAMMENVHAGVNSFIDGIGPLDTVSVITFGSSVTELTRENSKHDEVKSIINAIRPTDQNTALYKGVLDSVDIASKNGGRSVVLVITDGVNDVASADDSVKGYTKENIFERVTSAQVPLYCIGITDPEEDKTGAAVDRDSLRELAEATGGDQYFGRAANIGASLDTIQNIMRNTYMLTVHPTNADGRQGLQTTTFTLLYEPVDASMTRSNALQQDINWSRIPAPVYTPEPTVVPAIGLELDDEEIVYTEGGNARITGVIEVQQGSIGADALNIVVNGERWRAELSPNGADYIFSAEGVISATDTQLDVSAGIRDTDITSRHRMVNVVTPPPAATATPKPTLTLTLDSTNQQILFLPGQSLELSGVVEASAPVNVDSLTLIINDAAGESYSFTDIGGNQYEFVADYLMTEGGATELNISVQLDGTDITTRKQRLYLTAPTPTPAPVLNLTLDEVSMMYEDGVDVTIRGSVEVTGEVSENDLAVYVDAKQWANATIAREDDGSFSFEVYGAFGSGLTNADVRVMLISDKNVKSNVAKLELYTPTPEPTPVPTAKDILPPPTATPSPEPTEHIVAPTVTATAKPGFMGSVTDKLKALHESGKDWIFIVAAALALLIVALIVLLIVMLVKRKKKSTPPRDEPSGRGGMEQPPTVRPGMEDEDPTIGPGQDTARTGYTDDLRPGNRDNPDIRHVTINARDPGGTTVVVGEDFDGRETIYSMGDEDSDRSYVLGPSSDSDTDRSFDFGASADGDTNRGFGFEAQEEGGTERVDEEETSTIRIDEDVDSTVRLDEDDYVPVPVLDVMIDEERDGMPQGGRTLEIFADSDKVIGRKDITDVVINDRAVSGEHSRLHFDGQYLYLEDVGSSNGTRVNGEKTKLEPGEMRRLSDGDCFKIGKTTLTLHFGEPRMG